MLPAVQPQTLHFNYRHLPGNLQDHQALHDLFHSSYQNLSIHKGTHSSAVNVHDNHRTHTVASSAYAHNIQADPVEGIMWNKNLHTSVM
jgi:hypothetical protein